jgi:hypothetical protein
MSRNKIEIILKGSINNPIYRYAFEIKLSINSSILKDVAIIFLSNI